MTVKACCEWLWGVNPLSCGNVWSRRLKSEPECVTGVKSPHHTLPTPAVHTDLSWAGCSGPSVIQIWLCKLSEHIWWSPRVRGSHAHEISCLCSRGGETLALCEARMVDTQWVPGQPGLHHYMPSLILPFKVIHFMNVWESMYKYMNKTCWVHFSWPCVHGPGMNTL